MEEVTKEHFDLVVSQVYDNIQPIKQIYPVRLCSDVIVYYQQILDKLLEIYEYFNMNNIQLKFIMFNIITTTKITNPINFSETYLNDIVNNLLSHLNISKCMIFLVTTSICFKNENVKIPDCLCVNTIV